MSTTRKILFYWVPVVLVMASIFYLSSRRDFPVTVPSWAIYADKAAHTLIYGVLGFVFLRAWISGRFAEMTWQAGLVTVLFSTVYGASDEFHQMFVPGRTPSLGDLSADFTGAALVCLAIQQFYGAKSNRSMDTTG